MVAGVGSLRHMRFSFEFWNFGRFYWGKVVRVGSRRLLLFSGWFD